MPTHASEVAIVSLSGMPTHAENRGTIKIPPPIPSKPESAPAARPMIASRHHSSCIPNAPRSSDRSLGNAVRYAVYPTSAAVASISTWPLPGTVSDRRDPATEENTPNAAVQATTRGRIMRSRWYRYEPDADDGRIDGKVDPTA